LGISSEENSRRLVFLISIRAAVLSALLFISIFVYFVFNINISLPPILFTLAIAISVSLSCFVFMNLISISYIIYIQLFSDIILITLFVYFSGGIGSPFYFLYILPIIVTSIFLKKRDTIIIAALSFIMFGTISDLLFLKIVPYYSGGYMPEMSMDFFLYNMIMAFIAFGTVAFLSSYFFEKIKKAKAELKNIEDKFSNLSLLNTTILDRMENGFVTCDIMGNVISKNKKGESLLKINDSSNMFEIFHKSFFLDLFNPESTVTTQYVDNKIGDTHLGVSITSLSNISSYDRLFVFLITDLSETKKIEMRMKTLENLALIGEMAASIAHEIRNPLASISGSVQFLKEELDIPADYRNLMDIIVRESQRLSDSINNFLNFARQTPSERIEYNLISSLEEVLEIISLSYKNIKFKKKWRPDLVIYADPVKMKQMIWNLMNNAVKAVNSSGAIEILTEVVDGDDCFIVRDDGIGIAEEDLEKIFTPFFSKFSSGIGLGMSTVKQIVDEHGFSIEIKSEKNKGTEVLVCFKKK
jgi:two-component system, NtrC family, sensor histidine kinase PilS